MYKYRAVVLKDWSETEYVTVYDRVFNTRKEANEALREVRGHVKYVEVLEIPNDSTR